MILLHALEAPYDIPGIHIQRGDTMYHLLSDVAGPEGTAELLAFVRACGGRDAWMQSPGTYREHFDIFGEWADQARELGARVVTGREVGEVLARKRAQMQSDSIPVPAITGRQMSVVADLMEIAPVVDETAPMQVAVTRLAALAQRLLGGSLMGRRITVLCGSGHSGFVGQNAAEKLMHSASAHLEIYLEEIPSVAEMTQADLIIDALLGYGIDGPPRGNIRQAIINANASGVPILALDLPSGLDANEHGVYEPCIRATATMAVGLPKRGLSLISAQPYLGDVWLADIGYPRRIYKRVGTRVGDIFAGGPLVRLVAVPLAGDEISSDVVRWQVG